MAIFNTNEFLRKTFSKTIFGTAALRPEAVCADGFTLSIQASGIVNVFEYTESPMLNIKKFPEMSDEWLDFIAICRSGKHHDYDIVEGPMADDTIWNYVNDFLSGDISREAFWALAKFKHPTHQISFHTEVALKCLSFKEAIEV